MAARSTTLLSRWLVALSLATYAAFGVLGHGLHAILPCADGCCDEAAAVHEGCGCGHEHCVAATHRSDSDGASWRLAQKGHDAATCSICALLAKINVGYATFESADESVELVCQAAVDDAVRLPADLVLLASARGPPHA